MATTLLPTTVVGSYPVVTGRFSLGDPFRKAVRTAVADQVSAGIEIISDGQVRDNMIKAFTTHIPGVTDSVVTGPVSPSPEGITLKDTGYALKKHQQVKGIITGPTTLSRGLLIKCDAYADRGDLSLALADVLAVEARRLEKAGVTMLQIDEPMLTMKGSDLQTATKAVSAITSGISIHTCLHVCGKTWPIIDRLLAMPVDILDLELSDREENLTTIAECELRNRKIGFGCVTSADPNVESVEIIENRILRGIEIFGPEKLIIDPDCGLRLHSREGAFAKLRNMVIAASNLRKEYT